MAPCERCSRLGKVCFPGPNEDKCADCYQSGAKLCVGRWNGEEFEALKRRQDLLKEQLSKSRRDEDALFENHERSVALLRESQAKLRRDQDQLLNSVLGLQKKIDSMFQLGVAETLAEDREFGGFDTPEEWQLFLESCEREDQEEQARAFEAALASAVPAEQTASAGGDKL